MINKVYIVLLNYNGTLDTIECLESLLKTNYTNFQILVIDNSETKSSIDSLIDWALGTEIDIKTSFRDLVYPLVEKPIDFIYISETDLVQKEYTQKLLFIKALNNKGFAAGNNIALKYILKYAKEDSYIWLLNNDTVVTKEALSKQLEFITHSENNKIGILGSKLVYYSFPEKIQAVGGEFNKTFFISKHIGESFPVNTPREQFNPIDYVVGASMFLSYHFLRSVGILSEDYFLYFEELDWIYAAKKKKWSINWCEDSIVYHKEGSSIGSSSDFKKKTAFSEKELFRSRKIFIRKHYGLSFRFYLSSLLLALNRLRRRQFKLAFIVLKITFK